jgi:hypothetical protein
MSIILASRPPGNNRSRDRLIAGTLFSFIASVDDVNIALFLADVRVSLLAVQLLGYVEQTADPRRAGLAADGCRLRADLHLRSHRQHRLAA